jgi:phosphatidylserine/phosphatidylglycerophosphate/cardiolipin synthase-like enzyme
MTGDPEERVILAPEERRDAVLNVIRSARERLWLSLFRCSDQAILGALAKAVQGHVRVRVLLTQRAKASKKHLERLHACLQHIGAEVSRYADPVVKYHAKYIVADDGPALVSSLNFTRKCFQTTCDFILVTHAPELAAGLTQLFEADSTTPPAGLPDLPGGRLIVGPERARQRFAGLLQEARHSIRLIDSKLSDPGILTLLKAKAAAGVAVEVRGRSALGPLVPHGKLLIIDDATAVIGSISLATLALEFRRELAVVVHDKNALRQLNDFWGSLPPWRAGRAGARPSTRVP